MSQVEGPFTLFNEWFAEAKKSEIEDATAMVLSTSDKNNKPSSRVVLLKKVDPDGFLFFTNYLSKKGRDLKENPNAALCFYWWATKKQVRIEGKIVKASDKDSDFYFASRPRGSQIGAWASQQSNSMKEPDDLVKRVAEITEKFKGQDIPRPPFWGGYKLFPERIEFWKEGEYRLHTRLAFTKLEGEWSVDRLYP